MRTHDQAQAVPEPLHDRPGHEDAALEGIVHAVADLPGHGGDQPVLGEDGFVAAVHQQEAAGAVGILDRALLDAHLAEQGGLLVADHARDRDAVAADDRLAVLLAAAADLRQHRGGDAEEFEQVGVPVQRIDIEQHGPRGVGHVRGVDTAAGQVPDQPGVHRAEAEAARLGLPAGPGDVLQDPVDLGRAEIGVDDQPRLLPDLLLKAALLEAVAIPGSAAVLPHDGVADGPAGRGVPHDGGLALVGDAERHDGAVLHVRDGLLHHVAHRGPDLHGILLHPPLPGEKLGELLLVHDDLLPVLVEDNGLGTAGTLVEG